MKKQLQDDTLTLKYVPLKTLAQWSRNSKKHDLPALIKMIRRHGFKDPMKYEPALNNGKGGIVEGNGRDQALLTMYAQAKTKPPRGIQIGADGDWMAPVIFGVDAKSQEAAEAYGFDHNNATMMGGDFKAKDIMSMYQDGTESVLRELYGKKELPESIHAEDLDEMLEQSREKLREEETEIVPKSMMRILVSVPADQAIDIQKYIEALKLIPGVEVDISGN